MDRGFLAPILWRSVFTAYFITADPLARLELGVFLSSTLPQLVSGPSSPAWVEVVKAHKAIIGPRPAQAYAEDWTSGTSASLEEVRQYADIPPASWFWGELIDEVLARLSNLDDSKFAARLDRSIGLADLYPALEDKILGSLLERYARSENPPMHDGLVQRILSRWGSPHVDISDRTFLWSQVSQEAASAVMRWLAEEDLADFFELIKSSSRVLTSMDERRFVYWKRYTGRMQYTRLVLGTGYETTTNRDVRRFIDKRHARIGWLRGGDPGNIAILMKIDNHWFVEFSQTGNACFPYRDDQRPFNLNRKVFMKSDLGDPRAVEASGLGRMLHHRQWEEDFDRVLAGLNIWPTATATQPRHTPAQPRPTAARSAPAVVPVRAGWQQLVPGLSRIHASELSRIHSRVVDNRSKGGRYWIEIVKAPSRYLVEAMRVAGFRYSAPRGFYQ